MVLTYKMRIWDVQGTNNAIALFGGVSLLSIVGCSSYLPFSIYRGNVHTFTSVCMDKKEGCNY